VSCKLRKWQFDSREKIFFDASTCDAGRTETAHSAVQSL
jgi:hypothetical protein